MSRPKASEPEQHCERRQSGQDNMLLLVRPQSKPSIDLLLLRASLELPPAIKHVSTLHPTLSM
jgi:hypothetical protein